LKELENFFFEFFKSLHTPPFFFWVFEIVIASHESIVMIVTEDYKGDDCFMVTLFRRFLDWARNDKGVSGTARCAPTKPTPYLKPKNPELLRDLLRSIVLHID
jgi:hypothetical protein